RVIGGLADGVDVVGALAPWFEASPLASPDAVDDGTVAQLVEEGALTLVLPDEVLRLSPRPGLFDGVRDLDTVRLDTALAGLPAHELGYQHGVGNVVRRVQKGDVQAGVLLRPASVAQILEIAHGG